jgi:hypothetical protein
VRRGRDRYAVAQSRRSPAPHEREREVDGVDCERKGRWVCVYYCRTYYKVVCGGGRGTVKDMYYEVRRAEACVD